MRKQTKKTIANPARFKAALVELVAACNALKADLLRCNLARVTVKQMWSAIEKPKRRAGVRA